MSHWTRALADGDKQSDGADESDEQLNVRGQGEDPVGSGDEIDACRDHGCRVDQGAHRARARHGIGQPGLQRKLRRFSHGAAQEEKRCPCCCLRAPRPQGLRPNQGLPDAERVELQEKKNKPDGEELKRKLPAPPRSV